jgi:hypothetical protein
MLKYHIIAFRMNYFAKINQYAFRKDGDNN